MIGGKVYEPVRKLEPAIASVIPEAKRGWFGSAVGVALLIFCLVIGEAKADLKREL